MKIDGQVTSKPVDQWIALEPVLLYQAIMGENKCCVLEHTKVSYTPSLQLPVLKRLEQQVRKIRPELVLEKEIRKSMRISKNSRLKPKA
jgi:hypothetical protein